MARLTQKRRETLKPIFRRYQDELESLGSMDHSAFEREVREVLECSYIGFKQAALKLVKEDDFRFPLLFWMQHNNAPGPQSEFKGTLAKAYGQKSYKPDSGKEFWKTFPKHGGQLEDPDE